MALKLGIIGGMGSFASLVMFEKLIKHSPSNDDRDYPEIILHNNSTIPDRSECILHGGESPLPEMLRSIHYMEQCEVDYVAIACITAHHFYDDLVKAFPSGTILNILDETIEHIRTQNPEVERVGILASTGAIQMGLWQRKLEAAGLIPVILDDQDQDQLIMQSIYGEQGLKRGVVTEQSKRNFLKATEIMQERGAQAFIGGCSEVPLVLQQEDLEVPLFDSIQILVDQYFKTFKQPVEHAV